MDDQRVQRRDALDRHAFALLYRQRMAGRFEFDERTDEAIPQMDTGLEVDRVGIRRERGIQPSEERPDVRALCGFVTGPPLLEARRAQRYPYTP